MFMNTLICLSLVRLTFKPKFGLKLSLFAK